jgi:multiple sugar transport system substrate-binding protein
MDDKNSVSRRALLRGMAATGAGVTLAASGLPAFAQDAPKPDDALPVGAAGKLTVIHRTEYFEAAQTAFRDTVQAFADSKGVELDISTTNPESFGDFMGKMTAAVKAGNAPDFAYTSNVSISQLHLLDLVEDVTDVVEEAVAKYSSTGAGRPFR